MFEDQGYDQPPNECMYVGLDKKMEDIQEIEQDSQQTRIPEQRNIRVEHKKNLP